jgi:integrase
VIARRATVPIPAVAQLKTLLERHRGACGKPSGGFVFANANGKPMNLDALAGDVIQPTLETSGLDWHGWHAFRRGLATNLHRLGVSDKVMQQILRHANVTTTMNIYVKTVSGDAAAAMKTLETMCATTVQPQLARLCAGTNYGNLAEREGFEPSIQVLARITV